jgi:hypothetical protein
LHFLKDLKDFFFLDCNKLRISSFKSWRQATGGSGINIKIGVGIESSRTG